MQGSGLAERDSAEAGPLLGLGLSLLGLGQSMV